MDTLSEGEIGMLNDTAKLQNRITAAAVALFRKLGYEKTTVNDICREADIDDLSVLDFHFKSACHGAETAPCFLPFAHMRPPVPVR